jgi:hypothetical protein
MPRLRGNFQGRNSGGKLCFLRMQTRARPKNRIRLHSHGRSSMAADNQGFVHVQVCENPQLDVVITQDPMWTAPRCPCRPGITISQNKKAPEERNGLHEIAKSRNREAAKQWQTSPSACSCSCINVPFRRSATLTVWFYALCNRSGTAISSTGSRGRTQNRVDRTE